MRWRSSARACLVSSEITTMCQLALCNTRSVPVHAQFNYVRMMADTPGRSKRETLTQIKLASGTTIVTHKGVILPLFVPPFFPPLLDSAEGRKCPKCPLFLLPPVAVHLQASYTPSMAIS